MSWRNTQSSNALATTKIRPDRSQSPKSDATTISWRDRSDRSEFQKSSTTCVSWRNRLDNSQSPTSKQPSATRLITPPRTPSLISLDLTEHQVAIGSIVMLKPKPLSKKIPHKCVLHESCDTPVINDGAYEHPVAVFQVWDERKQGGEMMAAIAICSSVVRQEDITVPIFQREAQFQGEASFTRVSDAVIYLEGDSNFKNKTYMQISHIFAVPFSMLLPFGNRVLLDRLCEKSYTSLTAVLRLPLQPWVPTSKMRVGDHQGFNSTRFQMMRLDETPYTIKPYIKREINNRQSISFGPSFALNTKKLNNPANRVRANTI